MKQKTLFKLSDYKSDFGGALASKKRKTRRPLSCKNAIHLVLRANIKRSGSLLKHRAIIDNYFLIFARSFNVKTYKKALVSNHIHITALFQSRNDYRKFIRALTGSLAKKLKIKWDLRPWTRVLSWGRDFKVVLKYVIQNHLEAIDAIPYLPRRNKQVRSYTLDL